ncbi:diguanylate cyclase/phosphodiesterase [Nautilia profundicola AmH]|uniref:Diguanylate cyclase/phosphodiesterase n=1 Tax=Nautilia profundicola (strain ATCC BAA-1463 / DSM 18972 / AmH) TaxID=598659 RepID=B9L727_NAUPA|nr:EAL domain-containing protein [Nautilia profundicola]ACM92864.1 diguanylate cyclase/phosphodiesterase [Nautilia profundicola AmH]
MHKNKSKLIPKLIIALPVISVLISIILISIGTIYTIKHTFEKELKQTEEEFFKNLKYTTKQRIDLTFNVIDALYKNHTLDKNNTVLLIRNVMDKFRWPDNGYIFIFDSKGNTIYHINHAFIGQNRWNIERNGQKIVQMIINAALKHPEGTFVKYAAYFPNKKSMEKISYVKYYKPLDLVIGTGIYLNYLDKNLIAKKQKQKELLNDVIKIILLVSFISMIITMFIMYLLSIIVNKLFRVYDKTIQSEKHKLFIRANFDALTGLCNRECFMQKLKDAYYDSIRNNKKFAVLFIDIDYFKQINDTDGHKVGDKVLKILAERLKKSVRKTDVVSRFGGDEFLVLLKDIHSIEDVIIYTQRILEEIKKEIEINSKKYYVTGSIGISIYPDNGEDLDKLIIYADIAMYQSKNDGKDRFNFYNIDYNKKAEDYLSLKQEIMQGLKNKEFEIYFQPQFDKFEYLYGSEVLVRWNHPDKGFLYPEKFIPYAIELGLIDKIDLYVFEEAVKTYKHWYEKGYNPGVLSWNVTMCQLQKNDFFSEIKEIINKYKINPGILNLEITEESIMKNPQISIKMLNLIKELGISISVDDFGTGYSSLAYLKKLPIDKIKIDQSFISDIPYNRDDVIITKAIINLGKNLDLKVVAEGVKTKIQRQFVIDKGCDFIQGEYYSMPIDKNHFEEKYLKVIYGSEQI